MKPLLLHPTILAKLRNSVIIAFVIALAFVIFDVLQEWKVPKIYLKLSMKSSVDAIAQVFFDIGNGLNEKDSIICVVKKKRGFQVLRFALPNKSIKYIRFDPLNSEGRVAVQEIKLVNEFDQTIQSVDLKTFRPIHQIRYIKVENNRLIAETEKNANDPMLSLDINYPLSLNNIYPLVKRIKYNIRSIIINAPKKFFIVFMLSLAAMLFAYLDED